MSIESLGTQQPDDLETILRRADELSYQERRRAMVDPEGKVALATDPVESPLWAVGNYEPKSTITEADIAAYSHVRQLVPKIIESLDSQ